MWFTRFIFNIRFIFMLEEVKFSLVVLFVVYKQKSIVVYFARSSSTEVGFHFILFLIL